MIGENPVNYFFDNNVYDSITLTYSQSRVIIPRSEKSKSIGRVMKRFLSYIQSIYITNLFVTYFWAPLHAFLFYKVFHKAMGPISSIPFKTFEPNKDTVSFSFTIKQYLEKKNLLSRLKKEMLAKSTKDKYVRDIFRELPVSLRAAAYKLAISDLDLRSSVISYFGFMPRIHDISILYNIPVGDLPEEGSKLWHRDSGDCDYKNMKVFMPITDITSKNGPFYYLTNSEYFSHHKVLSADQNSDDPWVKNRVSNIKVDAVGGQIRSILNEKSGTRLLIDTVNTYHKGGLCESEDRLMLQISYHPNSYNKTSPDDFSEEIEFLKNNEPEFLTKEIVSEVMRRATYLNQGKLLRTFKFFVFKLGNVFIYRK